MILRRQSTYQKNNAALLVENKRHRANLGVVKRRITDVFPCKRVAKTAGFSIRLLLCSAFRHKNLHITKLYDLRAKEAQDSARYSNIIDYRLSYLSRSDRNGHWSLRRILGSKIVTFSSHFRSTPSNMPLINNTIES